MSDFLTFARAHGLEINPAKFYAGPEGDAPELAAAE